MANTSGVLTTTPWPTTAFYSTESDAWMSNASSIWLSSASGAWLSNATEYNATTIKSTNDNASVSPPPRKPFLPCNNPENLVDEATAAQVERLLLMTLLPLLEFFGITTNVINCVVFVKQGLRDRINLCLFSLALADISFLLLIFSAKFFSFLGLYDKDLEEYWRQKYLNTVLGPLMGTMNISNLMTMIISVERCICVVSPFTAKKFMKTRNMAIGIAIMAGYILGFYSLLDMKYVTTRVTDSVTNETRWVSRLSSFYTNNKVPIDILYNHLLSLTIPCLSLAAVIIATSITVSKLRATLAWRQDTGSKPSSGEKREAAVTKMLTVVCFIYVATIIPSLTQAFLRTLVPGFLPSGKFCNTFVITQTLAHVCEVTNSSVNFIVYFSMGSRFKATVKDMFGTRQSKPTAAPESSQTVSQEM